MPGHAEYQAGQCCDEVVTDTDITELFDCVAEIVVVIRAGERAGRRAEGLATSEKANAIQRHMPDAAARRPRDRDDLTQRMRDGRF